MTPAIASLAFVLLVVLGACFSALETALQVVREKGGAAEDAARKELLRDPVTLLSEILFLGGVMNLLLATAGLWLVLGPWSDAGWNSWIGALTLFGGGLLLVEVIPNACALHAPERT